jgi:hypothetical protein
VDQGLAPRVSIMASSSAPRRDSRFGCFRAPRAEVLARRGQLATHRTPFPCRYQPSRTTLLRTAQPRAELSALAGQQLALMGTLVVMSVYLQIVLGLDAFQTGKHLLPPSVAMLVTALRASCASGGSAQGGTRRRVSDSSSAALARTGARMSAAVRESGRTSRRALTTRASLPDRSPKAGSGIVAARDYDRLRCRSPQSSAT